MKIQFCYLTAARKKILSLFQNEIFINNIAMVRTFTRTEWFGFKQIKK
jgi:hypothetical protein